MAIILTNYEVLEKLAPIIQVNEKNLNPQMFAKLLQYMGLVRRYEKAFQEFQNLIQVLRQWEKPFNSLQIIREQYPNTKYQTPKEFAEKIPGLNLYHKYQEYINSHE